MQNHWNHSLYFVPHTIHVYLLTRTLEMQKLTWLFFISLLAIYTFYQHFMETNGFHEMLTLYLLWVLKNSRAGSTRRLCSCSSRNAICREGGKEQRAHVHLLMQHPTVPLDLLIKQEFKDKISMTLSWPVWLNWLEHHHITERLQVWFPVRAHA